MARAVEAVCIDWSMSRKSMPSGLTRWVDTGFPKRTCDNKYIESVGRR
jgi:hypothetical protein